MRTLFAALALLAAPAVPAQTTLYVCPDVPTDETASAQTLLPWTIARYAGAGPSYTVVLTVPGGAHLDGIHKLDAAGGWLLSLESASDLAGALAAPADPADVVRYDGILGTYAPFFCGAAVTGPVPEGSNVDALLLDGGDGGDLWLSFDVPTTIGGATFDPADLVAYERTGPGCDGWTIAAVNPAFDASGAGAGVPLSSNVVGADKIGSRLLLTFDVPTDLGPPGPATFTSDEVASWEGGAWSVAAPLAGWPGSSVADGLSSVGNPGRVPFLSVSKSGVPGQLVLAWTASCSDGATGYGIYEGTLGSWYSHAAIDCDDAGNDLTETIVPAAGHRYFLLVPAHPMAEGSYGTRSGGIERPMGGPACVATQAITSCP